MTVRVGVIGTGMIGAEHIRRLSRVLAGGQVVAVSDVDGERARRVADDFGIPQVHRTGQQVVEDEAVNGVLVTSWGPTHEEFVLASLAAGKPVFCEKPLATTQQACWRIIEAEMSTGRRYVQVGYMRRYDAAYRRLKAAVDSGAIGTPTIVHAAHRNASVPATYTSDMAISDTAVHDIDTTRWLLGEEIVAVRVLQPRRNSKAATHLVDPLLVLLEMQSGVIADVEINVNIGYGYDIRGEVVGESGTVALGDDAAVVMKSHGVHDGRVPTDWRERFLRAYDVELQEWLDSVTAGTATGPSSWDGYAATVVSEACLQALRTGQRVAVSLGEKPDFYSKTQ